MTRFVIKAITAAVAVVSTLGAATAVAQTKYSAEVRRTSYCLDSECARPLLEALDAAADRDRSAAEAKDDAARKQAKQQWREQVQQAEQQDAEPPAADDPPRKSHKKKKKDKKQEN